MKRIASSMLAAVLSYPVLCAASDVPTGEPRYDAMTEVAVRGTIVEVREVPAGKPLAGIYMNLKTKAETVVEVYLGPAEYVKLLKMPLDAGLKDVGVTGSKVEFEGRELILAREVRVRETIFSMRDEKGFPFWKWGTEFPTGL
jgi:hypothetical protein